MQEPQSVVRFAHAAFEPRPARRAASPLAGESQATLFTDQCVVPSLVDFVIEILSFCCRPN